MQGVAERNLWWDSHIRHRLTLTRADADMLCSPKGKVASIQSKEHREQVTATMYRV